MFRNLLGEEEEGHGDLVVVVFPGPAPVTRGHSLGETRRQKGEETRQDTHVGLGWEVGFCLTGGWSLRP